MPNKCSHLDQIKFRNTDKHVYEDCVKTGDSWVHLRLCLICGHVGCCDSSKTKHATKHFQKKRFAPGSPRFTLSRSRMRSRTGLASPVQNQACGIAKYPRLRVHRHEARMRGARFRLAP